MIMASCNAKVEVDGVCSYRSFFFVVGSNGSVVEVDGVGNHRSVDYVGSNRSNRTYSTEVNNSDGSDGQPQRQ